MGHLSAAAIVLGSAGSAAAPELAADEDAFTLLVEAGEAVLGLGAGGTPPAVGPVSVWGEVAGAGLEELGLALALSSTPIKAGTDGAVGLAHRLAEPSGAPALLFAVGTGPPAGARAVALLLGPAGESGIEVTGEDASSEASEGRALPAVDLAESVVRAALAPEGGRVTVPGGRLRLRAIRRGAFTGESTWVEGPPRPAGPTGRAPAPGSVDLATVSEGAYLPAATYREELPSRWRFEAIVCARCSKVSFPARGRCAHCGEMQSLSRLPLPRSGGVVEATTTVRPGAQPSEFDFQVQRTGAYDVLLVRLHPEVRVTLQATRAPAGSIRIGDRVDTVLRRLYPMEGAWRYGRKAVPAPPGAG